MEEQQNTKRQVYLACQSFLVVPACFYHRLVLIPQAVQDITGDLCSAACRMLGADDGPQALAVLAELEELPVACSHLQTCFVKPNICIQGKQAVSAQQSKCLDIVRSDLQEEPHVLVSSGRTLAQPDGLFCAHCRSQNMGSGRAGQ